MTLYDTQADVLRKAIMGSGWSLSELAARAGIPTSEIIDLLHGPIPDQLAAKLAPALDLDLGALVQLPDYDPGVTLPRQVSRVILPFEEDTVNLWLITSDDATLVIDAGFKADDLARVLQESNLKDFELLLTHGHRDHLGGIRAAKHLIRNTYAPAGLPDARVVECGDKLQIGSFAIEAIDLKGHHPRALGYLIDGHGPSVMAVGDAVFAGSIGGCPDPPSFKDARRTIEAAFLNRNSDLLLLPGHGPPTTLGKERRHNPFLAGWGSVTR